MVNYYSSEEAPTPQLAIVNETPHIEVQVLVNALFELSPNPVFVQPQNNTLK